MKPSLSTAVLGRKSIICELKDKYLMRSIKNWSMTYTWKRSKWLISLKRVTLHMKNGELFSDNIFFCNGSPSPSMRLVLFLFGGICVCGWLDTILRDQALAELGALKISVEKEKEALDREFRDIDLALEEDKRKKAQLRMREGPQAAATSSADEDGRQSPNKGNFFFSFFSCLFLYKHFSKSFLFTRFLTFCISGRSCSSRMFVFLPSPSSISSSCIVLLLIFFRWSMERSSWGCIARSCERESSTARGCDSTN